MPEIKTKPYVLAPGQTVRTVDGRLITVGSNECFLITSDHTVSDIIRFSAEFAGMNEAIPSIDFGTEESG